MTSKDEIPSRQRFQDFADRWDGEIYSIEPLADDLDIDGFYIRANEEGDLLFAGQWVYEQGSIRDFLGEEDPLYSSFDEQGAFSELDDFTA